MLAILTISAVNAGSFLDSQGITPFTQDTIVTIEGFDFNIPKGYGEEVGARVNGEIDEDGFTNYEYYYWNEDVDVIGIMIFYDGDDMDISDFKTSDTTYKTINGKYGVLGVNSDSGNELHYFIYVVDDKKAIMVTTVDESLLWDVIV